MKRLGTILKIINDSFALATFDNHPSINTTVRVAQSVNLTKKQQEETGLTELIIPKGELLIVSKQKGHIYLLSANVKEMKKVYEGQPMLPVYRGLFPTTGRKVVTSTTEYRAQLNTLNSLEIEASELVREGDIIFLD